MKRSLFSVIATIGAGLAGAGLAAPAYAATTAATTATTAAAHAPSWHTIFSRPNGGATANAAETVLATGRTSGWAFLAAGQAFERTGTTAWKQVAMPEKGGAVTVAGATSPGDVWAAYRTPTGTHVDQWNGNRWTVAKSFPGQVSSLSVLGPNDVWVFGGLAGQSSRGVFHFDGRHWTEVASAWQGGSALSDRNVWVYTGTAVGHFDGHRWTEANLAGLFPAKTPGQTTNPVLTGIAALSSGDVFAVGEGPIGPHSANGVILHFNGRSWSLAASGGFLSAPGQQVADDGHGGLWLSAGNVEGPSLLFHYSAGKVAAVYLPGSTGLPTASRSVSRIPGTTMVLAGGSTTASRSVVFQYS